MDIHLVTDHTLLVTDHTEILLIAYEKTNVPTSFVKKKILKAALTLNMDWLDTFLYECGHESEQAPGDGDGQGGLACCSPWGRKESDTTERLNSNDDIM